MSKKYTENLIDFNNEDDNKDEQKNMEKHSETSSSPSSTECHLMNAQEESESFINNPFDFAQKLATRPQDPFDIVEKEACVKARCSMLQSTHEVKMGKLLSLSDENILNDEDPAGNEKDCCERDMQKDYNSNTTIFHTAILHDLDSESPPISLSIKSTPDTCSSAKESDESSANSADGYSAKLRKVLESRKRLLKLSIANSTFNSPLTCRSHHGDSGFSTAFSAAAHFSDQMLATESPLKLVEDDMMTEEPPQISDAEHNFEEDLKMLSIPMLRKLPSPVPEETSSVTKENVEGSSPQNIIPSDLSVLREKLRAKRIEAGKNQNVVTLIDNLKAILCGNNGNDVDETQKDQANNLLQKLSLVLNSENTDVPCDEHPKHTENMEITVPQTIVRQGTFDMELQPSANDNCEHSTISSTISADISRATHSIQSTQSLSPPKEIPEAMIKSSATYDSEPVTERENLLLPHVETLSPIKSPNINPNILNEAATSHPDINDIIEQISRLFEQHQQQTTNDDGGNGNDLPESIGSQTSTICKPTFIVVMPTNNLQSINKQKLNSSIYEELSNDTNSNLAMRRRSQSLSLHDKVKIVQLPMRQQTVGKAEISPNGNIKVQNSVTNMEIKTPMRSLRRNSFSHGTQHTPLTSFNNGNGMTNTRRLSNVLEQSRYSLGPSKIQECEFQNQAIVHPIPRAANLNAFKPDLKKRCKQQSTKGSVMISKAPLKAMMPIKKIVPMLTGTMATPEKPLRNAPSHSQKASMETSIHLLSISGKISNTSTPMLPARNSDEQMMLAPNACSTPAFTSGATRSNSGTVTKKNSRFSNSTPTSKLQQPHTNSSYGLKKRPLPELTKAKSPVRVRNSLAGMPAKGRQSTKLSNIQKLPESRLSVRSNTRFSCGSAISTNKENKKP